MGWEVLYYTLTKLRFFVRAQKVNLLRMGCFRRKQGSYKSDKFKQILVLPSRGFHGQLS